MKYKKNMRILVLGEWDFAGAGYFLSRAINQTTENTSISVRFHPSTLGFPFDIMGPSDDELRNLWKQADVIHIHDDYRTLPADLQVKPTVVTYHGSLYRASPKTYNERDKSLGWLQTVATLDLTTLGPRWLPDTRPIEVAVAFVERSPVFKACHAPTKRKIKGTNAVLQACRKTCDLDLIENVQWDEALRRKAQCWITIDQFQLGYGCNAIEAWLMGQPVIGGATDELVIEKINKLAGYLPFEFAVETPDSIRKAIERLKNDQSYYGKMKAAGADYVGRFHSYQAVAAKALTYYHEAMEVFYSRGWAYSLPVKTPLLLSRRVRGRRPGPVVASGKVEIEYLGSSAGWVPFEVNGRKYRFSKLQPVQTVELADASYFLNMHDLPRVVRGKQKKKAGELLFRRAR